VYSSGIRRFTGPGMKEHQKQRVVRNSKQHCGTLDVLLQNSTL